MKLLIVGSGPSGLLLALMLAKKGVDVTLVEKSTELDKQPRATHYAAPAIYELARAGVLDEMYEGGFVPNGVSWRKLDGTRLTGLVAKGVIPDDYPYRMVCYPLDRLGPLLLKHVQKLPNVQILWSHDVTSIGQDADSAWVEAETPGGTKHITADYLVGCDGANSIVRRRLFGDFEFPGFTWDEQIVATNTYYDFDQFGWTDANFIVHPEHYFMAARISPHQGKEAMWRVTYGELPGLTREQMIERQPDKFKTFLPGHPEPDQYKIVNFSPYKIHQRCAKSLRVGRILLAADAAHLCNPFGGLGLTGGIADIGGLYDCLLGIHQGLADDSILDQYDRVRREIYDKVINPMSSENFTRLNRQDPEKAMENDPFFQLCLKGESDKEFSKNMQLAVKDLLQHDFTQYYKKDVAGATAIPS
ncbi:FAD binding domain-containing protein [Cladophialophora immunda]|nr:FAD binding domain-containing protein [Cladophialophora immunda]